MQSITLRSHVGEDGILQISVPIGMTDVNLEVMVIVQPIDKQESAKTPEELGWSPGFFEQTAGALADDPLVRPEQGEYEVRFENNCLVTHNTREFSRVDGLRIEDWEAAEDGN